MARKQAWYRAVSLNRNRRQLLVWLLEWSLQTANAAAEESFFFAFLPETYLNVMPLLLDTVLDFSFHDVQDQYDLSGELPLVGGIAQLLCRHIANPRVVLASCKDSIIQSLGTLSCHKVGIEALESIDIDIQFELVHAILQPYENRAWGQTNWLLLRFWLGDGFAYHEGRPANPWNEGAVSPNLGISRRRSKSTSYTGLLHIIAPAFPSKLFQALIVTALTDDPNHFSRFVNSLLGQLNWAFSEFVHISQEIKTALQKPNDPKVDVKQLKICSMCFELTISLLRALEMIITLIPDLFVSILPNGDCLLNRICQLLVQILTRTTIPIGSFQALVDANLPEIEHVTHFAILSVTVGVFLALMKDEINKDDCIVKIPKISRIFLTDPGFHIACLKFTLGECGMPPSLQNLPRGNFDPNLGREPPAIDLDTEERRNSAQSSKSLVPLGVKFDFRHCKLRL